MALEAGCRQRPNATDLLGLSGSVFSSSVVQLVDPSTLKSTSPTQLSTAAIAGIAAGGVALVVLVAAIVFVRCRSRRNRSGIGRKPRWDKSHRRRSSFSFKCRNILASPLSPKFFTDLSPVEEHPQQYGSLDAQMSGVSANVVPSTHDRYYIESKSKIQHPPYETALNGWRSKDSAPEQMAVVPDRWNTLTFPEKKSPPKKGPITINTTEAALSPPPAAHQSPRANQFGISPSATQQYSPAGGPVLHTPVDHKTTTPSPSQTHHGRSPRSNTTTMSSQGNGYPSLNNQSFSSLPPPLSSSSSSSPLTRQQQHGWPGAREGPEPWFPPPPTSSSAPSSSLSKFSRKVSPGNVRRGKRESGSPVESKQIQVLFPAPPQR